MRCLIEWCAWLHDVWNERAGNATQRRFAPSRADTFQQVQKWWKMEFGWPAAGLTRLDRVPPVSTLVCATSSALRSILTNTLFHTNTLSPLSLPLCLSHSP